MVGFSNVLTSWPSEQDAGNDIATAVWQLFWLPRYSYGSSMGVVPQNGAGSLGVVMNGTAIPYNLTLPSTLNTGYLRIVFEASPYYQGKQPVYSYIGGRPRIGSRGIVAMQPTVLPNATNIKITFNITSKPKRTVNYSSYISVYDENLSPLFTVPGPEIDGFSANSAALIVHQNIGLGPGRYIMMLRNFSDNTEMAGGYFVVPPYNISLIKSNVSAGIFVFKVASGGAPINNVRYRISLNGLYSANGIVQSGIISYELPQGAPQTLGRLGFIISMLGQNIPVNYNYSQQPFAINTEYIEVGVVLVMMIIMLVFVRAPQRDEFYIDVPNLPEEKKVEHKAEGE